MHCSYISRRSTVQALAFYDAVFDTFDDLCESPMLGSDRAYSKQKLFGLRMWFVKDFENYLVFYRVFGNYIEIVRVPHSAQNRDEILFED